MTIKVAVGLSSDLDAVAAVDDAAAEAREGLDGGACDLCLLFVAAPYLDYAEEVVAVAQDALRPGALIGCGAGGVVGARREIEEGPGVVVWALSAPEASFEVRHLTSQALPGAIALGGLPDDPGEYGDAMFVLADPHTFSAEALLEHLNEARPGMPALGGLASAQGPDASSLFLDGEVVSEGAVTCSVSGLPLVPCVSQGATPVGPEMAVTEAEGNVITGLASKPALERLREAIDALTPRERLLAGHGLLLGVVIDENQPEYERGDFLVRPIVGADPDEGSITVAERVRVGQTVRLHVRDGVSADVDLREALAAQTRALGPDGAAGALVFTCNGRGAHMFSMPDHDANAVADVLGAPAGGFFCAGEIGPVGGRNFLHGFTATIAVLPRA
jgi:small ligand-binding sensory domain FIST